MWDFATRGAKEGEKTHAPPRGWKPENDPPPSAAGADGGHRAGKAGTSSPRGWDGALLRGGPRRDGRRRRRRGEALPVEGDRDDPPMGAAAAAVVAEAAAATRADWGLLTCNLPGTVWDPRRMGVTFRAAARRPCHLTGCQRLRHHMRVPHPSICTADKLKRVLRVFEPPAKGDAGPGRSASDIRGAGLAAAAAAPAARLPARPARETRPARGTRPARPAPQTALRGRRRRYQRSVTAQDWRTVINPVNKTPQRQHSLGQTAASGEPPPLPLARGWRRGVWGGKERRSGAADT